MLIFNHNLNIPAGYTASEYTEELRKSLSAYVDNAVMESSGRTDLDLLSIMDPMDRDAFGGIVEELEFKVYNGELAHIHNIVLTDDVLIINNNN